MKPNLNLQLIDRPIHRMIRKPNDNLYLRLPKVMPDIKIIPNEYELKQRIHKLNEAKKLRETHFSLLDPLLNQAARRRTASGTWYEDIPIINTIATTIHAYGEMWWQMNDLREPVQSIMNQLRVLGDTLDWLALLVKAPIYASANDISVGEGYLRAYGLGDDGRYDMYYGEINKNIDWMPKSFVIDLGMEILLDPMNWITFGAKAGVSLGLKKASVYDDLFKNGVDQIDNIPKSLINVIPPKTNNRGAIVKRLTKYVAAGDEDAFVLAMKGLNSSKVVGLNAKSSSELFKLAQSEMGSRRLYKIMYTMDKWEDKVRKTLGMTMPIGYMRYGGKKLISQFTHTTVDGFESAALRAIQKMSDFTGEINYKDVEYEDLVKNLNNIDKELAGLKFDVDFNEEAINELIDAKNKMEAVMELKLLEDVERKVKAEINPFKKRIEDINKELKKAKTEELKGTLQKEKRDLEALTEIYKDSTVEPENIKRQVREAMNKLVELGQDSTKMSSFKKDFYNVRKLKKELEEFTGEKNDTYYDKQRLVEALESVSDLLRISDRNPRVREYLTRVLSQKKNILAKRALLDLTDDQLKKNTAIINKNKSELKKNLNKILGELNNNKDIQKYLTSEYKLFQNSDLEQLSPDQLAKFKDENKKLFESFEKAFKELKFRDDINRYEKNYINSLDDEAYSINALIKDSYRMSKEVMENRYGKIEEVLRAMTSEEGAVKTTRGLIDSLKEDETILNYLEDSIRVSIGMDFNVAKAHKITTAGRKMYDSLTLDGESKVNLNTILRSFTQKKNRLNNIFENKNNRNGVFKGYSDLRKYVHELQQGYLDFKAKDMDTVHAKLFKKFIDNPDHPLRQFAKTNISSGFRKDYETIFEYINGHLDDNIFTDFITQINYSSKLLYKSFKPDIDAYKANTIKTIYGSIYMGLNQLSEELKLFKMANYSNLSEDKIASELLNNLKNQKTRKMPLATAKMYKKDLIIDDELAAMMDLTYSKGQLQFMKVIPESELAVLKPGEQVIRNASGKIVDIIEPIPKSSLRRVKSGRPIYITKNMDVLVDANISDLMNMFDSFLDLDYIQTRNAITKLAEIKQLHDIGIVNDMDIDSIKENFVTHLTKLMSKTHSIEPENIIELRKLIDSKPPEFIIGVLENFRANTYKSTFIAIEDYFKSQKVYDNVMKVFSKNDPKKISQLFTEVKNLRKYDEQVKTLSGKQRRLAQEKRIDSFRKRQALIKELGMSTNDFDAFIKRANEIKFLNDNRPDDLLSRIIGNKDMIDFLAMPGDGQNIKLIDSIIKHTEWEPLFTHLAKSKLYQLLDPTLSATFKTAQNEYVHMYSNLMQLDRIRKLGIGKGFMQQPGRMTVGKIKAGLLTDNPGLTNIVNFLSDVNHSTESFYNHLTLDQLTDSYIKTVSKNYIEAFNELMPLPEIAKQKSDLLSDANDFVLNTRAGHLRNNDNLFPPDILSAISKDSLKYEILNTDGMPTSKVDLDLTDSSLFFTDTETIGGELFQLSVVIVDTLTGEERRYNQYLELSEEALKDKKAFNKSLEFLNITQDEFEKINKLSKDDALAQFNEMITSQSDRAIIVAHNTKFDMEYLKGVGKGLDIPVMDTVPLFRLGIAAKFPEVAQRIKSYEILESRKARLTSEIHRNLSISDERIKEIVKEINEVELKINTMKYSNYTRGLEEVVENRQTLEKYLDKVKNQKEVSLESLVHRFGYFGALKQFGEQQAGNIGLATVKEHNAIFDAEATKRLFLDEGGLVQSYLKANNIKTLGELQKGNFGQITGEEYKVLFDAFDEINSEGQKGLKFIRNEYFEKLSKLNQTDIYNDKNMSVYKPHASKIDVDEGGEVLESTLKADQRVAYNVDGTKTVKELKPPKVVKDAKGNVISSGTDYDMLKVYDNLFSHLEFDGRNYVSKIQQIEEILFDDKDSIWNTLKGGLENIQNIGDIRAKVNLVVESIIPDLEDIEKYGSDLWENLPGIKAFDAHDLWETVMDYKKAMSEKLEKIKEVLDFAQEREELMMNALYGTGTGYIVQSHLYNELTILSEWANNDHLRRMANLFRKEDEHFLDSGGSYELQLLFKRIYAYQIKGRIESDPDLIKRIAGDKPLDEYLKDASLEELYKRNVELVPDSPITEFSRLVQDIDDYAMMMDKIHTAFEVAANNAKTMEESHQIRVAFAQMHDFMYNTSKAVENMYAQGKSKDELLGKYMGDIFNYNDRNDMSINKFIVEPLFKKIKNNLPQGMENPFDVYKDWVSKRIDSSGDILKINLNPDTNISNKMYHQIKENIYNILQSKLGEMQINVGRRSSNEFVDAVSDSAEDIFANEVIEKTTMSGAFAEFLYSFQAGLDALRQPLRNIKYESDRNGLVHIGQMRKKLVEAIEKTGNQNYFEDLVSEHELIYHNSRHVFRKSKATKQATKKSSVVYDLFKGLMKDIDPLGERTYVANNAESQVHKGLRALSRFFFGKELDDQPLLQYFNKNNKTSPSVLGKAGKLDNLLEKGSQADIPFFKRLKQLIEVGDYEGEYHYFKGFKNIAEAPDEISSFKSKKDGEYFLIRLKASIYQYLDESNLVEYKKALGDLYDTGITSRQLKNVAIENGAFAARHLDDSFRQMRNFFGTPDELYNFLRKNNQYSVVTIIPDATKRRGMVIKKVKIRNAEDIKVIDGILINAPKNHAAPFGIIEDNMFNNIAKNLMQNFKFEEGSAGDIFRRFMLMPMKATALLTSVFTVNNAVDITFKNLVSQSGGIFSPQTVLKDMVRAAKFRSIWYDEFYEMHKVISFGVYKQDIAKKWIDHYIDYIKKEGTLTGDALKDKLERLEIARFVDGFSKESAAMSEAHEMLVKMKEGIIGTGKKSEAYEKMLNKIFYGSKFSPFKFNMQINSEMELVGRLALHMNDLKKGLTKNESLSKIINTHFDYSMKTKAELYAEFAIPFVSYPLRSFNFWADAIFDDGNTSRVIADTVMTAWGNDELSENDYVQYQASRGNLPGGDYVWQTGFTFADAMGMPFFGDSPVPEQIIRKTNPFIKAAFDTERSIGERLTRVPVGSQLSNINSAFSEGEQGFSRYLPNLVDPYYRGNFSYLRKNYSYRNPNLSVPYSSNRSNMRTLSPVKMRDPMGYTRYRWMDVQSMYRR